MNWEDDIEVIWTLLAMSTVIYGWENFSSGAEEMQEDLHPSILAFGKKSCLMGEKYTLKSIDPGF